jgi:outer membrane biosynthesis protein TonB
MIRRTGLCLLGLLPFAACRHAPPHTGASAFAVVETPRTATPSCQVIVGDVGEPSSAKYMDDFRQAVPLKATVVLPVYPAKALKAKAGRATVGVQVAVDSAGNVTDIGPSLLTYSTPGPFAEDFLEAVKVAVRQWRFRPAEIIQMETATSGGFTYQRIARTTKTETKLDMAFTFTATGTVEAGK